MKRSLAALLLVALAGCATTGGEGTIAQSWMGAPIDDAVRQWGIPQRQHTLTDGSNIYEWSESQSYALPQTTTATIQTQGNTAYAKAVTTPGSIEGQCVRQMTTDPKGIVVDVAWRGNNCCVMAIAGYCASLIRGR